MSSDRSDRSPGEARPVEYAQRFVVLRRDADDVQGVRFASGRVLVDDDDGNLETAVCVEVLVEAWGGERRVKVVWEGDRPPARCCAAPAGHDLAASVGEQRT